jgi:hypothetical protein
MTPHERMKRYAQLVTALTILVWGLLCFLIIVSPRTRKLHRVEGDLTKASKELAEMKKEIENAAIVGAPAAGESRYEKFGILGTDEEQLFLSDLIAFCKETNNTLNIVRRADVARAATVKSEEDQNKRPGSRGSSSKQPAAPGGASVPQPVIAKVPHTVNYSGTFLSSFYLLRKLEAYKRLLTVERVEIAADTRYGYPRANGNITIDLYLVRNPGEPPTAPPQTEETESKEAADASQTTDTGDRG